MRVWSCFSWDAKEASFSRRELRSLSASESEGSEPSEEGEVWEGHWEKPFGRWFCQGC